MNTQLETLGERLARIRQEKGLTQDQLAKMAGVGQSTVAGIENNSRSQIPGSLIDIAHALSVNAYWLKTGIGSREPSIEKSTDHLGQLLKTKREYVKLRTEEMERCEITDPVQLGNASNPNVSRSLARIVDQIEKLDEEIEFFRVVIDKANECFREHEGAGGAEVKGFPGRQYQNPAIEEVVSMMAEMDDLGKGMALQAIRGIWEERKQKTSSGN